jgi:hypothetical protein
LLFVLVYILMSYAAPMSEAWRTCKYPMIRALRRVCMFTACCCLFNKLHRINILLSFFTRHVVWNIYLFWSHLHFIQIYINNPSIESREYGFRDPSRWPRGTLYPQKLALTSATSGVRSICIVRSRTQAMEFNLVIYNIYYILFCYICISEPCSNLDLRYAGPY